MDVIHTHGVRGYYRSQFVAAVGSSLPAANWQQEGSLVQAGAALAFLGGGLAFPFGSLRCLGEGRAHREADALVGGQGHLLARADRLDFARGNLAQTPGAKADEAHLPALCQILRHDLGKGIQRLFGVLQAQTRASSDLVDQLAFAHNVFCCHLSVFLLRVHGKDKAVSLSFHCFALVCAHAAMLHDRAGLCQESLSPAGYVPAWHGGAGSARRHLLSEPQVPMTWTSEPGSSDLATRAERWRAERVRGQEEECQVLDPPHRWWCSTWAAARRQRLSRCNKG